VIQAYLALTILEETLDVPPGERYVQQRFQRNIWSGIREKVLALAGQDFSGDDQAALSARYTVVVGKVARLAHLPDDRALLCSLDEIPDP